MKRLIVILTLAFCLALPAQGSSAKSKSCASSIINAAARLLSHDRTFRGAMVNMTVYAVLATGISLPLREVQRQRDLAPEVRASVRAPLHKGVIPDQKTLTHAAHYFRDAYLEDYSSYSHLSNALSVLRKADSRHDGAITSYMKRRGLDPDLMTEVDPAVIKRAFATPVMGYPNAAIDDLLGEALRLDLAALKEGAQIGGQGFVWQNGNGEVSLTTLEDHLAYFDELDSFEVPVFRPLSDMQDEHIDEEIGKAIDTVVGRQGYFKYPSELLTAVRMILALEAQHGTAFAEKAEQLGIHRLDLRNSSIFPRGQVRELIAFGLELEWKQIEENGGVMEIEDRSYGAFDFGDLAELVAFRGTLLLRVEFEKDFEDKERESFLAAINEKRSEKGVSPVVLHKDLCYRAWINNRFDLEHGSFMSGRNLSDSPSQELNALIPERQEELTDPAMTTIGIDVYGKKWNFTK